MADAAQATEQPMNPAVLARLTGGLGDAKTLARIGADIGALFEERFADAFENETGFPIEVTYEGCEAGLFSSLIEKTGTHYACADVCVRGWCPHFVLACGNGLPIALMASMLGALPEEISDPEDRPLSRIELDAASLVLGRMADVLRMAITAENAGEPALSSARNLPEREEHEAEAGHVYAISTRVHVQFAGIGADLILILPQRTLLKSRIATPKKSTQMSKASKEWANHLTEQVRRSHVTLEARIQLQALSLGTIARLAPGDVIPFFDDGDVHVEVNANGKELYACEFGRSGQNYTVRIKDNTTSDEELLRHLLKG